MTRFIDLSKAKKITEMSGLSYIFWAISTIISSFFISSFLTLTIVAVVLFFLANFLFNYEKRLIIHGAKEILFFRPINSPNFDDEIEEYNIKYDFKKEGGDEIF